MIDDPRIQKLAAAHYYLEQARRKFHAAITAPDASKAGEKFNPVEDAAYNAMYDAEQAALDAAEEFLIDVESGECSCEECEAAEKEDERADFGSN